MASEDASLGTTQNEERTMPTLAWAHPVKQGFATVARNRAKNPIAIYYELHGQGVERVAMLMGMNSTCQAWDYQTTHFGVLDGYTVLTFDARGVGWTGGGWDWYDSDAWAADFLELLDHVGWTTGVHAVGHSAGGQALLRALLIDPDRFKSAALLNTTAGGLRPLAGPAVIVSNLFASDPKKRQDRLIRINYTEHWLQSRAPDTDMTQLDLLRKRLEDRDRRTRPQTLGGMLGQAVASLRHRVTGEELIRIRESEIPILVLTTSLDTWDNFVYLSHSEYLNEKLSPWRFVVFEDTGHNVPTARHQELNQLLEAFWKYAQ
ncbi:Alpha/Beta hydrolase protein [Dichotomocladium elegans]|nr:Alpha/Beta hydrolase protein [Dichotomocladium elegans]